jgi:hypothetical protein
MDESPAWLKLLADVAAEESAAAAVLHLDATLAAVAPGALKDGQKIYKSVRTALARRASNG